MQAIDGDVECKGSMIDVRSDTVTRPDAAMRRAMMEAEVGDDVYGDDPTVNRLQDLVAELTGHEAALFLPTGTQSNLVALLTHCQRGDEYIVGADAHTYMYEGGGAAALGGIQPQTLPFGPDGGLPLADVVPLIKACDVHFARTRLLCLENTQHGRVQSLQSMQAAQVLAQKHELAVHLDGARMANAAVKLNESMESIARCFDSVSICLSKGLGAPVGSVLVGSKGFITEAHRWRKVTGGGMRQAGIIAAAGILAITDGVEYLAQDHENAAELDRKLSKIDELNVRSDWTQTNMVWFDFEPVGTRSLADFANENGVLMSASDGTGRIVMHRDVSAADMHRVADVVRSFFSR